MHMYVKVHITLHVLTCFVKTYRVIAHIVITVHTCLLHMEHLEMHMGKIYKPLCTYVDM